VKRPDALGDDDNVGGGRLATLDGGSTKPGLDAHHTPGAEDLAVEIDPVPCSGSDVQYRRPVGERRV
jgi:hypothetical protein